MKMIYYQVFEWMYQQDWVTMAQTLWPDTSSDELKDDLKHILSSERERIFLAFEEWNPVGFAHFAVRLDYVPGAHRSPTGYLEGIFVKEEYRKMGIGRGFLEEGENWLKTKGCTQIGSDTWLWNTDSQDFHKRLGFIEEERVVQYIKDIKK